MSALVVITLAIGGSVYAQTNDRASNPHMMEKKAEILGITADELQNELDSGKNFKDIAEAKGIDLSEVKKERGFGKRHGKHSKKGNFKSAGIHKNIQEALGLSDEEVETLKNSTDGKTVQDLLNEKGLTKESLKEKAFSMISQHFNENFDKHFDIMAEKEVSKLFSREKKGSRAGFGSHKMTEKQEDSQ
ncbi:hypothetical protein COB57_03315 [Candidatus Peregrinibacteria bacterium]|nr:MAG: hypothetical protein COB57_03315 [Candidatus Peregrinibacteria bacterium]